MNHREQQGKEISILVVEDSLTQAEEIRFFLESHRYHVAVCHDGQEALERLRDAGELPDVVISDVMMPRMDGYELCKAMRADETLKALPVILLTSLSSPTDIIKSIEAGANKFLTKPFDQTRLPEVVDELYINTSRRKVERMEMGIRLVFGGNDFLITADKVQILDLLLSSYQDAYYQNIQLQQTRSDLEQLNADLEQKVLERTKELRIQEERFRTLAEHLPDLVVRFDRAKQMVYANHAVENLLGIPCTELIGKSAERLEELIRSCPCGTIVTDLFDSGEESRLEFDVETSKGIKWLDSSFVPEYNEEGSIEYALKVSRDITTQKEAEKLLYLKNQAIATAINGIALVDLGEGKISYVNRAFLKMWEYKTEEELLGHPVTAFLDAEPQAKQVLDLLHREGEWIGELKGKKCGGELFDVQAVAHKVTDQKETTVSYMLFFMDISEQKRIEAELKHKEELMLMQSKQAAMGDMVAMIAHQWRQPITVISMAANNLQLELDLNEQIGEEQLKKMLETVSAQTQHLSKTIDDFRNFFKPNKAKEMIKIGKVLDNTMQIIGKSLENNNIRVEITDESVSAVKMFPNEMMQVFLNIFNNAKDAFKNNGIEHAVITVRLNETDESIRAVFSDNAGGIPDEVIKRMGEPYFTTKGKNGTGLGLYMSKMIIEKHLKGTIQWCNEDGGACFTIVIPKLQDDKAE